ncbi:MAG TPA: TIGR03619 family F420-dependent LLM class oxidoreductase [Jatrophihabitantaceae bacterium]|jgi:probable F420-dependent oxidoreductase
MEFGCSVPFTDVENLCDSLPRIVEGIESRGFDSMWLGEHTHLPLATTHAYTEDGSIPDRYRRFPDPWAILAATAALTRRIRLGTLVCLVAEHNPLVLSKLIATVDQLSGGRVEVGVGYGWNRLEMINNGIDPGKRRAVLKEKVAALRALWSSDHAGFDGEFVRFSESWSLPSPVQRPGPRIHLGCSSSEKNFRAVASFADGWFPNRALLGEDIETDFARLRTALEQAERPPGDVEISIAHPGTSWGRVTAEKFAARLPDERTLETYRHLGVSRVVVSIPNLLNHGQEIGVCSPGLRGVDRDRSRHTCRPARAGS